MSTNTVTVLNPITDGTEPEAVIDADAICEKFSAYLADESKLASVSVAELAFAENTADVSLLLAKNYRKGLATRVSGARTGLAGGAVPEASDHLISVERIKGISAIERDPSGEYASVRVGAGVTLHELTEKLKNSAGGFFFPVDPTETWASIGGMISTNASGARSFHYGSMRNWVLGFTMVLADGHVINLERRAASVRNGRLVFEVDGEQRALESADLPKPATKNTLGYSFAEGLDALDLFVGSEGTLGIFTEIRLRLEKLPAARLFYMQLFPTAELALEFVKIVRDEDSVDCLAIEFLDERSLQLAVQGVGGSNAISRLVGDSSGSDGGGAAVYLEVALASADQLALSFEAISKILENLGVDGERSYAGDGDKEMRELKAFRHAVPEQINALIARRKNEHPGLHKIATDMAVPDAALSQIYSFYRSRLAAEGLDFAIFGHAGNNHFHVNILPRSFEELGVAKKLYLDFAREVVRLSGAVAAEHGIGRMKRDFFAIQYPPQVIESMRQIKKFFDPKNLLNRGVIFNNE